LGPHQPNRPYVPDSWQGCLPNPPVAGLVVGGLFGISTIHYGLGAALFVALCAVMGMGIGWAVGGAASGRLDLRGAFRALLRRG
jgi:hypothetical protein